MNEAHRVRQVEQEETAQRSIFTLSKPFEMLLNGIATDIHGVEMRAFDAQDLPLLDQFRGQPIALAQNVVAALCDLTIEQVQAMALEDFTPMADDALWQISQICCAMGLTADFFFQQPAKEGDAPPR